MINSIIFDIYEREINRYGGKEVIEACERVFFKDSKLIESFYAINKKMEPSILEEYYIGMLPVKRTIKNNKFLYRQPCYGWRYFMLLLYIAHDISLVSLHAVSFEVVGCCSNLCN